MSVVEPAVKPPQQNSYISNPLGLIQPSWAAVRLNWVALVLPIGLVSLWLGLTALLLAQAAGRPAIMMLGFVMLVAFLIGLLALIAYPTVVLLDGASGHQTNMPSAARRSLRFSGRIIIVNLLSGLVILAGLLLLVVPGFIFIAWFALAPSIIVREDVGAVEAMKRSKKLVQGRLAEMWGMLGLGAVVGLIGVVPVVGSLAAALFSIGYMAAPMLRYLQLSGLSKNQRKSAKIDRLNYVVIVLAVLALPINVALNWKDAADRPYKNSAVSYLTANRTR